MSRLEIIKEAVYFCRIVQTVRVAGSLNCANINVDDSYQNNVVVERGVSAGYGVKCESNCRDIVVSARGNSCQRAYISVDDSCHRVVAAYGASEQSANFFPAPQPCPLDDGVRFSNPGALYLAAPGDPCASSSIVPTDLAQWSAMSGAVLISDTERNSFCSSTAFRIRLAEPSPPQSRFRTTFAPAAGRVAYRLEVRARLLNFIVPVIENRTKDIASLSLALHATTEHLARNFVRLGEGWQDYYVALELPAASGATTVTVDLALHAEFDPIECLIDFIRVVEI